MIDFNNTWCKATEENREALKKLNIKIVGIGESRKYFYIDTNGNYLGCADTIKEEWKQIHLVNGEFQYVETSPKNNFKDYGFEANFEGEILKKIDNMYIGYYLNKKNCPMSCTWWDDGLCSVGTDLEKDYNLKPIKKEWYENPDNIGKAIIIEEERLAILKSGSSSATVVCIDIQHNAELSVNVEKCRPATKEEVLTLLVKE